MRLALQRAARGLPNLALMLGSFVVALLSLEVVARVERAQRPGGRERNERAEYMDHDPRLGWRMRPGAKVVYDRREYRVEVQVNALGLRDVERDLAPRAGIRRALALGDSFVEGYTVPLESAVTRVLERSLTPACRAEVWNAGVGGYSTSQQYLFYVDRGRHFGAELVLLFLYYNDIVINARDNYWGVPVPVLREQDGELVLVNEPVARPRPRASVDRPPRPRSPLRGSAALDWLAERLLRGAPDAYEQLAKLGLWDPLGGDRVEDAFKVYRQRAAQSEVERAWALTHRILEALARAVEAEGARFAVVYVPSRMEVSDRDWELTRRRYSLDPAWDRGLVARRLGLIARAARFPVIDLTAALRDAEQGGATYLPIDGHWNARGHRVAAEALAQALPGVWPTCAVDRTPAAP